MTSKGLSPEERAKRGKRMLLYGMFALVVVTFIAVWLALWIVYAPLGVSTMEPLRVALIVSAIALVASLIVWFVYTRVILK